MATRWHYQRLDLPAGPVPFDDLVRFVRDGELGADDLVREEWNPEWRPAALAVGLFHMAGRQDLFDQWEAARLEAERRAQAEREAADRADGDESTADPDEPSWMRRLRQLEAERRAQRDADEESQAAALAEQTVRIEIDETLQAALTELEARDAERHPSRWQRWTRRIIAPRTLHLLFRWTLTIAIPGVVAWQILDWSALQNQRYPERRTEAAARRAFPFWGLCDQELYYFLLADTMLATGVVSYGAARILESFAED